MKYIKLFNNHNEYLNDNNTLLPNVSYCKNENEFHYKIEHDPDRFIAIINVISTTETTNLFGNHTLLSEIEIDDVTYTGNDIQTVSHNHIFNKLGPHIIKYTLNDNITSIDGGTFSGHPTVRTSVGNYIMSISIPDNINTITSGAFSYNSNLSNVIFGNNITTIGPGSFSSCKNLKNIIIPNTVTSIGDGAFGGCLNLTSITSLATSAPSIYNTTFRDIKEGGTLYVPTGSTGYDTWIGTGNYYLGKYNWTKVEQ